MGTTEKSALIIGASRGLGLALVREFAARGWRVLGTAQDERRTGLHEAAAASNGTIAVETIDITRPEQIVALRTALNGSRFDLLFVNAGVANSRDETIGQVSTEEFVRVLVTNALSTMRVVEQLADSVKDGGTIGIMSSGQGSITNNEKGGFEIYRASKAALNMLMRSFAARRTDGRSLLLMAPGWVRTDMGGPDAPFSVAEVIPAIADTIIGQDGHVGLQYLDRFGKTVPW